MSEKYSISDLTRELGISRTAVNRKIKKYRFNTVQEYVDGRPLKLVELSREQLEALKKEAEINKCDSTVTHMGVDTNLNNSTLYQEHETHFIPNKTVESILEHSKTMLEQVRHYADQAIESERKQVKLLTNSESIKEQEYLRTQAENKQLQECVKILENTVSAHEHDTFIKQQELDEQYRKIQQIEAENSNIKEEISTLYAIKDGMTQEIIDFKGVLNSKDDEIQRNQNVIDSINNENKSLKQQIQELQELLKGKTEQFNQSCSQNKELENKLDELNKKLSEIQDEKAKLEESLEISNKDIGNKDQEIKSLKEQLEKKSTFLGLFKK